MIFIKKIILQGYEKLTVNIDTTFTGISQNLFTSVSDLTINAAEQCENYAYVDGIFYDDEMSYNCIVIPQEEVTIPEGVTSIPKEMFEGNTVIKSVSLPETTKRISEGAFKDCPNIQKVNCDSKKVEFEGDGTIFADGSNVEVSVPSDFEGDNFGGSSNIVNDDTNPSNGDDSEPSKDGNNPDGENTPDNLPEGNTGLGGGEIAGIVIAIIVVIAAVIGGIVFFLHKKKSGENTAEDNEDAHI